MNVSTDAVREWGLEDALVYARTLCVYACMYVFMYA
jgi:hypothetical protein